MSQTWDVTLIPTDPNAPAAYVERRGAPRGVVTVRLKALDGTWETCGADRARGVWPENVSGIRADTWGSKTVGFDLRRDPKAIWPDIAAFTRVQIDIDGVLRWSGRVAQTPVRDDLDSVISVQCEGMQAHLDDDLYERVYVHTRLADWKDMRSLLTADLTKYVTAPQVQAGDGALKLSVDGSVALPANGRAGVVLDLGPGSAAKRLVLTYEGSANSTNLALGIHGADSLSAAFGVGFGSDYLQNMGTLTALGASGTFAYTLATAYRYVAVVMDTAAHTPAAEAWFKVTSAQVFADTTFESGGASVLTADDVVLDALDRATMLLSADRSLVAAGSFNIPEFAPSEPRTPRQVWEAADAFEDRLKQIDLLDRAVYRAKPTVPVVEVGAWSAMSFEDASANDGSEVYSRVIVKGTQPDGSPLRVVRSQAQQPGAKPDAVTNPAPVNASFDTDTTGWTAIASAITRDTGSPDSSPAAGRWDATGASDPIASYAVLSTNFSGTFYAGVPYVLDFALKASAAGTFLRAGFGASIADGTIVESLNPSGIGTSWADYRIAWTPLRDHAGSSVVLQLQMAAPGSAYYRLDSLLLSAIRPTIVDRQGFQRTKTLDVSFTLTTAAATQLADLWLRAHQRTPFKGTVKLTGHGAARDILTGVPLPVDALLPLTGELIRFTDRIDPDTGAVGRDARIAEVSVDPDTDEATVTLDNTRAGFDALLSRLDVVLGQNQSR